MEYDGLLFGNGLTLNLLYQLKSYMPEEKHYLLNIDNFLHAWINGNTSVNEDALIYSSTYGDQKNMEHYLDLIKQDLILYYQKYTADIESFLGKTLFVPEDDKYTDSLKSIKFFFPALYNIWYIILMDYLKHENLYPQIVQYYDQVKQITGNPQHVWTTNFDLFAETLIPEHIHGRFLPAMNYFFDIAFHFFNGTDEFYYKYVWGHNGTGKMELIQQLRSYPDHGNYFDFDFFFDNSISIHNILIYGMGFKEAGYIPELKTAYPKYNKTAIGGIIDDHILLRIAELQKAGRLNQVDVTYFDENEKQHLHDVLNTCEVQNYRLIKCQDFDFQIQETK